MKFKKNQIVYCQGEWKCKVVKDFGKGISYIALEGFEDGYKGTELHASKFLFTTKRRKIKTN